MPLTLSETTVWSQIKSFLYRSDFPASVNVSRPVYFIANYTHSSIERINFKHVILFSKRYRQKVGHKNSCIEFFELVEWIVNSIETEKPDINTVQLSTLVSKSFKDSKHVLYWALFRLDGRVIEFLTSIPRTTLLNCWLLKWHMLHTKLLFGMRDVLVLKKQWKMPVKFSIQRTNLERRS